ncbi:hypothetical protein XELAEV_18032421mg [Xenopus laevis]|uniref:Uncharacterized protein n=1 Tax=Xenopus laevis TaxID=8355 RepID=A0A974HGP6_XENLA|nr:hypothetical protein XELAEV_18032421mg [Xenopus laevis]
MSFGEIAASTDERAKTFGYTEEDITRIISTADNTVSFQTAQTNNDLSNRLLNVSKKDITLSLHSSTLIEYVKAKRIPRGLRSGLQPLNSITDPEFHIKWEGIWNKASLDAMVLTIQYLQPMINKTHKEIEEVKSKLMEAYTEKTDYDKILTEIKSGLDRFRKELLTRKLRKFERDTKDYAAGKVYVWKDRSPRQQQMWRFGLPGHRRARDQEQDGGRHTWRNAWSSAGSDSDDPAQTYRDFGSSGGLRPPFFSGQGRGAGDGRSRCPMGATNRRDTDEADGGQRRSQRKPQPRQFYRP